MKRVAHWFSRFPEAWNDDWDGELRWYQRTWEHSGDRLRVMVGDITDESDSGDYFGARFDAEISLWANTGQFDVTYTRDGWPPLGKYEDHSVSVYIWRWGVYIAWRGQLIRKHAAAA